MPQALLDHVKVQLLPFLRCSALFFHFLTEIPGPAVLKGKHFQEKQNAKFRCQYNPVWIKTCSQVFVIVLHCLLFSSLVLWSTHISLEPSSPSLTEELPSLCRYLSVPSDMTRLFQWNQDSGCISSSVISTTVKRFVCVSSLFVTYYFCR